MRKYAEAEKTKALFVQPRFLCREEVDKGKFFDKCHVGSTAKYHCKVILFVFFVAPAGVFVTFLKLSFCFVS